MQMDERNKLGSKVEKLLVCDNLYTFDFCFRFTLFVIALINISSSEKVFNPEPFLICLFLFQHTFPHNVITLTHIFHLFMLSNPVEWQLFLLFLVLLRLCVSMSGCGITGRSVSMSNVNRISQSHTNVLSTLARMCHKLVHFDCSTFIIRTLITIHCQVLFLFQQHCSRMPISKNKWHKLRSYNHFSIS